MIVAREQEKNHTLIERVRKETSSPDSSLFVVARTVPEHDDLKIYGVTCNKSNNFRAILPTNLRSRAFRLAHCVLHQGAEKTLDAIRANYEWPDMTKDILEWTRACPICQSCKIQRHNRTGLCNYPNNNSRFHTIHLDVVGPLPESEGKRYILTARDRGTGLVAAAALPDKTSHSVLDGLINKYISYYSLPSVVITDNGREFCSTVFDEFCRLRNIRHKKTTPYNPKCNGAIERIHRTLKTAFRAMGHRRNEWAKLLPWAVLTINNATCDINSHSPFQHAFGRSGKLPGSLTLGEMIPSNFTIGDETTEIFIDLMGLHQKSARPLPEISTYLQNDLFKCAKVWVRNDAVTPPLYPLYSGPHTVLERHDKYFVIRKDEKLVKVGVDRLKVFVEATRKLESKTPPSTTLDRTVPYNLRPRS